MTLRKQVFATSILLLSLHLLNWHVPGQDQAPLVEETIYLKHTRICLGGDDCDGNLLRLIKPLLSKRGSVEVVGEARLIITDERPRVDKISKVALCYDNSTRPPEEREKECS
jgi:hypothetical protein